MNIHSYYQLIREEEDSIAVDFPWIASLPSRNGGIDGRISQVDRKTAARMVVEGTARLATSEEVRIEMDRLQATHRRTAKPLPETLFVNSALGPKDAIG